MKNIKIIILSITLGIMLICCKNENADNAEKIKTKSEYISESTFASDNDTTITTELLFYDENGKEINVDSLEKNNNENYDEKRWRRDAKKYLELKEGKTVEAEPYNNIRTEPKTNSTNFNRKKTPTKNNDFEYSEYWRKEAFKVAKQHLNYKISKENCNVIGQGYFQPNLVKYIGNRGYSVKIRFRYDCHQNYINEVYFLVEVYYRGGNNWDVEIVDQRFDD